MSKPPLLFVLKTHRVNVDKNGFRRWIGRLSCLHKVLDVCFQLCILGKFFRLCYRFLIIVAINNLSVDGCLQLRKVIQTFSSVDALISQVNYSSIFSVLQAIKALLFSI